MGDALLGRVVDPSGQPLDHRGALFGTRSEAVARDPINAMERSPVREPLDVGVRAINAMLTVGRGQRLGLFAGSGVGKSVLMGMMARYTQADVAVIALVGERGREVNEFLDRDLGAAGRQKSVVVVATSDEPALLRVQAAYAATTIAEHFRDAGKDVLLVMDSVTRFALAQREIGLAAGEPPTTRGFPPSTFALLPKLVERAGRTRRGSITAFYSVLVEGDDENEPVADTMRGLLDGHVWLTRRMAERGHYPAIDVLRSISRLANDLSTPEERQARQIVRELMAAYAENEDLITIGAYRKGANRTLDAAVDMRDEINVLLRQQVQEPAAIDQVRRDLVALAGRCAAKIAAGPAILTAPQPAIAKPAAPAAPARKSNVIKRT